MPINRRMPFAAVLLAALALAGCNDPRECWLGISHEDCSTAGTALAQFPQDDAICRDYGLTPGTRDYAICRQKKRAARAETEQATDYGFLQNPLLPDVKVAPAPAQ
jgi:hypothetical protein